MIIVHADATPEQVQRVVEETQKLGLRADVSRGYIKR